MSSYPLTVFGFPAFKTCALKVTNINHMTRSTIFIFQKLLSLSLAFIIEQIWLLHCKYWSHCPRSKLAYKSNTALYLYQNPTNCNFYFTCYCHLCNKAHLELLLLCFCHICAKNKCACHFTHR